MVHVAPGITFEMSGINVSPGTIQINNGVEVTGNGIQQQNGEPAGVSIPAAANGQPQVCVLMAMAYVYVLKTLGILVALPQFACVSNRFLFP